MKKKSILSILALIIFANFSIAQADRWQQHIDYKIKAALDVTTNIVKGTEELVYTNNSPDKCTRPPTPEEPAAEPVDNTPEIIRATTYLTISLATITIITLVLI